MPMPAQTVPQPRWGLVRQRRLDLARPFGTAPTARLGFRFSSSASDTNRFIGQALPNDTTERVICAFVIVSAERLTVAVAEIELGHVAVEMLLGAMLVHALHAPLEDAEIAFDGVGVHVAATILTDAVAHELMLAEGADQIAVLARFIGVDGGLCDDVLAEDRNDGGRLEVLHDDALGPSGPCGPPATEPCACERIHGPS